MGGSRWRQQHGWWLTWKGAFERGADELLCLFSTLACTAASALIPKTLSSHTESWSLLLACRVPDNHAGASPLASEAEGLLEVARLLGSL